ncbi:MAG: class I mannose-6-phosphate isomerase [Flavobacteriales bacterium]|nr:class I mannose-6-phosphate isomerase [Flavobacteriales bacterium]
MKDVQLYPFKFQPILKEKIWGGNGLKSVLNKDIPSEKTGESWELSGVKGDISVVANGELAGKDLQELLNEYEGQLVGKRVYEQFQDEFPLLIKFIDAQDDLSIQVHPNDDLAKVRHNSFGKTEMWYVIHAEEGAELISGFNQTLDKQLYLDKLENKELGDILNSEKVKAGDVFFIPVGRVHAIRAGIMLAEIQQTSDITYRIYDWDRVDDNGQERELHTEYALDALDFNGYDSYKTEYTAIKNERTQLEKCSYFETNLFELNEAKSISYDGLDSFVIYMLMEGEVNLKYDNYSLNIKKGETVLLPASINEVEIEVVEEAKLLEVYLPR